RESVKEARLTVHAIKEESDGTGVVARLARVGGGRRHVAAVLPSGLRVGGIGDEGGKGGVIEGQNLDQLRGLYSQRERNRSAIRPSDQVHGTHLELTNERREIIHMRDNRVLLARVRPRGGAEVALGRRDVAVLPRNRLALAFPGSAIGERTVNEDD